MFFFFKQKTAYEMRISDWSSDVCSSDLDRFEGRHRPRLTVDEHREIAGRQATDRTTIMVEHRDIELNQFNAGTKLRRSGASILSRADQRRQTQDRSEERRVGNAWVSTCR